MDLNADLGEGYGGADGAADIALLDVVTSANVACGFHAGDVSTMRLVAAAAVARGVTIGAHVSYRDREGFGRRPRDVAPGVLRDEVVQQLGALDAVASAAGGRVAYVKPHGALYHRIATDPEQAAAVVDAVAGWRPGTAVLGPPGSVFLDRAAAAGLPVVTEAFPDRAYGAGGSLVDRASPGAVLSDPDVIAARAVHLAIRGSVTTADGSEVEVAARSLCLHGDSPGAVAVARAVRTALVGAGVTLAPFA